MKLSLGQKIVLLIVLVAVLLSGTCVIVSSAVNRRTMEKEYIITADSMAATVAVTTDGDRLQRITDKIMEIYHASDNRISNDQWENPDYKAYTAQFLSLMEDEDYIAVREELRRIQDVSEVDCIYTFCICPEDSTAVYIVDGAYEGIVTPGCFDMVEECCYPYLNHLEQGFPAFVTNTPEYGWGVTACAPIYNSNGGIVCFSAVDLSMNEVLEKENHFLFVLATILLILIIVVCLFSALYVKYILSSNVKLTRKSGIKALKLKRNNRTQLVKIGGM